MERQESEFTRLYCCYKKNIERYVHYKISNYADAEDILQEVASAAFVSFPQLSDPARFKQWILRIAHHKCVDYYRKKSKQFEMPLDEFTLSSFDTHGKPSYNLVQDTLDRLLEKDKQILYLFYFKGFNQKDIATRLHIPVGTVKSRVHCAKQHFKSLYPVTTIKTKGCVQMKSTIFPTSCPPIQITPSSKPPFSVRLEEIPGYLIIPRLGQSACFAFYDDPDGILTAVSFMKCTKNAEIHGIPCVQVEVEEQEGEDTVTRTLFLRLTDTHSQYIAESFTRNGTFCFGSFLDDEWLSRFQVGEDNCGREILQIPRGNITTDNKGRMYVSEGTLCDLIGRYQVKIGDQTYDTVALAQIEDDILTLQYLNTNGRTILFRRYNKNDWKIERYHQKWTQRLPQSETLTLNEDLYVHWYDCIPDAVLSTV